jgi:ribosomal protein L37AE/L43A
VTEDKLKCAKCAEETTLETEGLETWRCHKCKAVNKV